MPNPYRWYRWWNSQWNQTGVEAGRSLEWDRQEGSHAVHVTCLNRAEIEKLKKAADDQTLSTQERIKAAEKAAAMEKEDLKIQTDLAKARIANMLGYTKVTKEALKTIEDMQKGAITAEKLLEKSVYRKALLMTLGN